MRHDMKPLEQVWPPEFARRYQQAGYWTGDTFSAFLRRLAASQPERLAVVAGEQRWSYAELYQRANRVAAGLLAQGLRPGDRVVVQLANVPAFLSVAFGLFRADLIPLFALPAHRRVEVSHFVREAEARALIVGPSFDGFDYQALALEVQAECEQLEQLLAVGEIDPERQAAFTSIDAFNALSVDEADLPSEEQDPAQVALVQISGGTTGLSKLIPRTHNDYIYSFRASAEICGLTPESVYLGALPVAHNFPMSSPGVFGALYAGSCVVMSPSPSPNDAFALIEREKVSITGLVPPLALVWMQAAPVSEHDLSSLEVLQVGGAKFTPEMARQVKPALGCTLQQVFGMAEGLVNYTRLDDPDEVIIHTQGRPISADDEVLVLNDQGEPVAEGEPGNLLTRGPYTIRGYHNNPAANAKDFTEDGFYRTGDIVARDAKGYLTVMGRASDHINRAGEKISAEEIEDHLIAHPGVLDAAVVAVPDEHLGERSCAFVVAHPASDKPPRSIVLKRWIRERGLAEFKVPDQIKLVSQFSTTPVGKISRKELRARLRDSLEQ